MSTGTRLRMGMRLRKEERVQEWNRNEDKVQENRNED